MDVFLGSIVIYGFDWAPRGWARCDGQLLAISQNDALFSLLGTIYGGDGRTTFGLPDLRGRVALHEGAGPGLSDRKIGSKGGTETNTMNSNTLASHTHTGTFGGAVQLPVSDQAPNSDSPSGNYLTQLANDSFTSAASAGEFAGALQNSITVTLGQTGSSGSINDMQPYLVMNYSIALVGMYPSRN